MPWAHAQNSAQLDAFFNSAAGTWGMTLFLEYDLPPQCDLAWTVMSYVFANRKYLDSRWAARAGIAQGSWQTTIRGASSAWSNGDLTSKAYTRMATVFNSSSNSADCETLMAALALGGQMLTAFGAGPLARPSSLPSKVQRGTLYFYYGDTPTQINTSYWHYEETAEAGGFSFFRIWPIDGSPGDLLNPPPSPPPPKPEPAPVPPLLTGPRTGAQERIPRPQPVGRLL